MIQNFKLYLPELDDVFAVLDDFLPLPGFVKVAAFAFILVAKVCSVGAHQNYGVY